ncbi:MAG: hypothetical protein HY694_10185 [Deltaproteobacteria bacterium]|nr:hypothetical protein [Deltaproteobacteria bacterium]
MAVRDCWCDVSLLTAHRILISTAVVFFFGFALWELRNYWNTGNLWASARSLLYLLVALGFGLYLRSLKRWLK